MMIKLLEAIKLIEQNGEPVNKLASPTENDIKELESYLSVKLPPSYKLFLQKYGFLEFLGERFYGLTKSGIQAKSAPSTSFLTMDSRNRGDISDTMVHIKSSGYGPSYCIETAEINSDSESPVYEVPLSYKRNKEKIKISESFGDFFYEEINNAIDDFHDC